MAFSRREFLGACAASAAGLPASAGPPPPSGAGRAYHLCLSPDALEADPGLLEVARGAGVTDLWLTGFLYGYWHYPLEQTRAWKRRVEQAGMAAHLVNVPLGHPGDSLGATDGEAPLTPPRHWQPGVRLDGSAYAGTSLHPPATEENARALRRIQEAGFRRVFLDDDFRLAQSPGTIGGCFCARHRQAFLRTRGYGEARWQELLDAVRRRDRAPVLREWLRFTCDELAASFRAQQAAAPAVRLGIMVMYLGAEKAGIRLADYRDVPFRVGELHFDDGAFGPAKGKTDELFSALFHRRYARPELAYSETTAFPADRLSARNMAAKLAVSTLADVRSTMFMSGLTAFPRAHWQALAPAMRRQADLHRRVAGHRPRGPFKHFWGEPGRETGDDNPFSLFLAAGVPFEVTDRPARDGWTFLSDFDARAAAAGSLRSPGTLFLYRPEAGARVPAGRDLGETLPALFAFKREIAPRLTGAPFVEEEVPAVCAWYPTARAALLWNLSDRRETLTLRFGGARCAAAVDALDTALLEDLSAA